MRPTELIVRNYRSFAGEHRIELRPLTLLFGDNSSGKSALARVLPLLADATGPYAKGPPPLEMQHQLATEISAMARGSSRAIVVETHSRALFWGVQLELAAGRLRPEDVIVHSIRHDSRTGRSYADRVELSEDGSPDRHWPHSY